jgi:uncharacterized protein YndB with AHSA1/START domain
MDDFYPGMRPAPLVMSRLFKTPRETLFLAWSSAGHIKQWFSPVDCSVREAEIDFRPGGVFAVCMLLPDGTRNWSRGTFVEIVAPERLSFAGGVSSGGTLYFNVHTTVTFAEESAGTRMTVEQAYEIFDESARHAIGGATEGWRTTLDKLETLVTRLSTPAVFGSFTLERVFPVQASRVFHALTNMEAKAKWFSGGPEQVMVERYMDATPGGRERAHGRWPNGNTSCFDAVYFDVVPDRRLVYAYEMHLNGEKISVSLATLELSPAKGGTRLVVTEQGSFLDGYADNGSREEGTGFLLDQLGASLTGVPFSDVPPANCSGQNQTSG